MQWYKEVSQRTGPVTCGDTEKELGRENWKSESESEQGWRTIRETTFFSFFLQKTNIFSHSSSTQHPSCSVFLLSLFLPPPESTRSLHHRRSVPLRPAPQRWDSNPGLSCPDELHHHELTAGPPPAHKNTCSEVSVKDNWTNSYLKKIKFVKMKI